MEVGIESVPRLLDGSRAASVRAPQLGLAFTPISLYVNKEAMDPDSARK